MAGLSKKKKLAVFSRDNGECQYCGKELIEDKVFDWHVDHVVSVKNGGNNDYSNLMLACAPCNSRKSGYDIDYFRGMMAINSSQYKGVINFKQASQLEALGVSLNIHDFKFHYEVSSHGS